MKKIELKFDENGLIPAIIQDAKTKEVLTLAYMNEESLQKSLETGQTWFFSRSRQELWNKGATSGNTQEILSMTYDCDQDALLVQVNPAGPACHKGDISCFSKQVQKTDKILARKKDSKADLTGHLEILSKLEEVIADRFENRPEGAYTTYLFTEGVDKILKKIGEEATEVVIAAKNRSKEELSWEAADLIYHLLVLLEEQDVSLAEILQVLEKRHFESKE